MIEIIKIINKQSHIFVSFATNEKWEIFKSNDEFFWQIIASNRTFTKKKKRKIAEEYSTACKFRLLVPSCFVPRQFVSRENCRRNRLELKNTREKKAARTERGIPTASKQRAINSSMIETIPFDFSFSSLPLPSYLQPIFRGVTGGCSEIKGRGKRQWGRRKV